MSQKNQNTTTTIPAKAAIKTFKSFDDFRVFVEIFNGQVLERDKTFKDEVKKLKLNRRVETYVTLGQAREMATVLLADENREHYIALLSKRQIAVAREEQNKFLPLCKLLFGHYDEKGKFVIDPSALAYAPVLRYLDEHHVDPANVAGFIEGFSGQYGKKLDGIRRQDQHDHGNGSSADAEQAALDLLLAEPASAEFSVEPEDLLGEPTKGKLIAMWGEWNDNRFIPRGFINSTTDQVEKLARKQAVAHESALRRRDLARKEARIVELEAQLQAKASR